MANGSFKWNGKSRRETSGQSLKEQKQQYNQTVLKYTSASKNSDHYEEFKGKREPFVFSDGVPSPTDTKHHKKIQNLMLKDNSSMMLKIDEKGELMSSRNSLSSRNDEDLDNDEGNFQISKCTKPTEDIKSIHEKARCEVRGKDCDVILLKKRFAVSSTKAENEYV